MSKNKSQYEAVILDNVSYKTKGTVILDKVSLSIKNGEIFFLIGKNGSGKSTIIKALLGLIKFDGDVVLLGDEVNERTRKDILQKIGVMLESASLYPHLTVFENLDIIRRYYNIPVNRIYEVLNVIGLENEGSKQIRNLSSGMKQKLGIGLSIIHQPKVIILDEPTNNLDPVAIVEIRNLIIELNKRYGTTFFVTSHLLSEVEKTATTFGILKMGKIVMQGGIKELVNWRLVCLDLSSSKRILESKPDLTELISFKIKNGQVQYILNEISEKQKIQSYLSNKGVTNDQISELPITLEELYLWNQE